MEIFRDEIHVEAMLFDSCRGGGADRGELRPADLARVVVKFVEHLEERIHPVGAGENNPLVSVRILHQFAEFPQVGRRFAADEWQLVNIGPEIAQGSGEF